MTSRLDNAQLGPSVAVVQSHDMPVLQLAHDDLFHVVHRLKDEFAFDLLL